MAGGQRPAEALRQRRAGRDPARRAARVLPGLEEHHRGHGEGHPLRPGGFAGRDRAGRVRMAARNRLSR